MAIAFLASSGFLFLLHPQSSVRAASSLFLGIPAGCSQGITPHYPSHQADAIIINGSGIEVVDGTIQPNQLEGARIKGGDIAYEYKVAPKLLFIEGLIDDPTEGGNLEVKYAQQVYQKLTHDPNPIPPDAIKVIGHTISNVNTATNMDELKKEIDARDDITTVVIVIDEIHQKRAVFDACERGIPATSISVESLFRLYNEHRQEGDPELKVIVPLEAQTEGLKLFARIWDPRSSGSTIFFQTFGR